MKASAAAEQHRHAAGVLVTNTEVVQVAIQRLEARGGKNSHLAHGAIEWTP